MENGDILLFSLQKANSVTPGNSALQQENKSTLFMITADSKWWNEHDPQSVYRDNSMILNLTETALYILQLKYEISKV